MTDDTEQLLVEIPAQLKQLIDADQRYNRQVVESALWREYGGQKQGQLERRIEEKEQRIQMLKRERNEREREIEDARETLEALEERQAELEEQESVIDAQLDKAADVLTGVPLTPDNPAVENWAGKCGLSIPEFIDEMEDRR